MNIGGTTGAGGDGLFRHLTKAKNERVEVLAARGIMADDLRRQLRTITALAATAGISRPVFHFWTSPNPRDRKPTAEEEADLIRRLEEEFNLADTPRVMVRHTLTRDLDHAQDTAGPTWGTPMDKDEDDEEAMSPAERHPSWDGPDTHLHPVYLGTDEDGHALDQLRKSRIRRQRVVKQWQVQHGFQLTPCKHVTAILDWCDKHDPATAAAMRAAGFRGKHEPRGHEPSPAAIALYDTPERSGMETHGIRKMTAHALNKRADTLAAWKEADGGAAWMAALEHRGYRLVQGDQGAMIADPSGDAMLAAKLIGEASSHLDGKRIVAAEVKARLAGLVLPTLVQVQADLRIERRKEKVAPEVGGGLVEVLATDDPDGDGGDGGDPGSVGGAGSGAGVGTDFGHITPAFGEGADRQHPQQTTGEDNDDSSADREPVLPYDGIGEGSDGWLTGGPGRRAAEADAKARVDASGACGSQHTCEAGTPHQPGRPGETGGIGGADADRTPPANAGGAERVVDRDGWQPTARARRARYRRFQQLAAGTALNRGLDVAQARERRDEFRALLKQARMPPEIDVPPMNPTLRQFGSLAAHAKPHITPGAQPEADRWWEEEFTETSGSSEIPGDGNADGALPLDEFPEPPSPPPRPPNPWPEYAAKLNHQIMELMAKFREEAPTRSRPIEPRYPEPAQAVGERAIELELLEYLTGNCSTRL